MQHALCIQAAATVAHTRVAVYIDYADVTPSAVIRMAAATSTKDAAYCAAPFLPSASSVIDGS